MGSIVIHEQREREMVWRWCVIVVIINGNVDDVIKSYLNVSVKH